MAFAISSFPLPWSSGARMRPLEPSPIGWNRLLGSWEARSFYAFLVACSTRGSVGPSWCSSNWGLCLLTILSHWQNNGICKESWKASCLAHLLQCRQYYRNQIQGHLDLLLLGWVRCRGWGSWLGWDSVESVLRRACSPGFAFAGWCSLSSQKMMDAQHLQQPGQRWLQVPGTIGKGMNSMAASSSLSLLHLCSLSTYWACSSSNCSGTISMTHQTYLALPLRPSSIPLHSKSSRNSVQISNQWQFWLYHFPLSHLQKASSFLFTVQMDSWSLCS